MSKLPSWAERTELAEQEADPGQTESAAGICYYRKALHLQSIAEELLADARAESHPDITQTTDKLLHLVEAIRDDNPDCWKCAGACPRCPEPRSSHRSRDD